MLSIPTDRLVSLLAVGGLLLSTVPLYALNLWALDIEVARAEQQHLLRTLEIKTEQVLSINEMSREFDFTPEAYVDAVNRTAAIEIELSDLTKRKEVLNHTIRYFNRGRAGASLSLLLGVACSFYGFRKWYRIESSSYPGQ